MSAIIPREQRFWPTGWVTIYLSNRIVHVIPAGDLRDHEASEQCWCHPDCEFDEDAVYHNAMDRREDIESGRSLKQ